jgi:hypothetical protein
MISASTFEWIIQQSKNKMNTDGVGPLVRFKPIRGIIVYYGVRIALPYFEIPRNRSNQSDSNPFSLSIALISGTQIRSIESNAFQNSRVQFAAIPACVEILGCGCFARCALLLSVSFEVHSRLKRIESNAFSYSALKYMTVPRTVEILGRCCFAWCSSFSLIVFEPGSQLRRLEINTFSFSRVEEIVIPQNVDFIDPHAFADVHMDYIAIEKSNIKFHMRNGLLTDVIHHRLIRNFSSESMIEIPDDIEVLGTSCFSGVGSLLFISFGCNSRLKAIESNAFSGSNLQLIMIPREVEVLGSGCLSGCHALLSVSFEPKSRLKRIGVGAFSVSALRSIEIPQSVEVLERWCFSPCISLASVTFEIGSRLKRIEFGVFFTPPGRITLPRSVECIESGFADICRDGLSIEPENVGFAIRDECLVDIRHQRLICTFSNSSTLTVPRDIMILGSGCFSRRRSFSFISFLGTSQLRRIESAAFSETDLKSITIPRSVEFLGTRCFSRSELSVLSFESDSQLLRIESEAFSSTALQSLVIPRTVRWIAGSAFTNLAMSSVFIEKGNPTFEFRDDFLIDAIHHKLIRDFSNSRLREIPDEIEILGVSTFCRSLSFSSISFSSNSNLRRIESMAFAHSSLQSIMIPRSVETLGCRCFSECRSLSSISFESNSRLIRIEAHAFSASNLQTIIIPQNVCFIDGSAFADVGIDSILLEDGNETFEIRCGFLIDRIRHKLIRNFSDSSVLEIPADIEILGSSSSLRCQSFSSIAFAPNSQLRRIESRAFHDTFLCYVRIPSTCSFIAGNAFGPNCDISLNCSSSYLEFEHWKSRRLIDPLADFRQPTRFQDWTIDLTLFDEGISLGEANSSVVHRRFSDGFTIIVRPIRNLELTNEIRRIINLRHPCLINPIGYVTSIPSIMRVIRLYSNALSLTTIFSRPPQWWTDTTKAIVLVAVAVSLRFLHSFGFVHGNLKPNNIFIDESQGIQIADMASFSVNSHAPDGFTAPEVCDGGEMTTKADVFSLIAILFRFVIGDSHVNQRYLVIPGFVPEFVARLIESGLSSDPNQRPSINDIIEIFQKNDFMISENVRADEVSSYLASLEASESASE